MQKLLLILGLIFYGLYSNAQIPENLRTIKKEVFKKESYYLELLPKQQAKGLVILFPGLFDHPYSIFIETTLAQDCVKSGYIVMIPVLSKENDEFDLSDSALSNLSVLIEDIITSNKIDKNIKTVLGGFSIGGTRAIRFYNYNIKSLTQKRNVSFVFAIDPPLDLKRLLDSEEKRGSDLSLKVLKKELGENIKIDDNLLMNYSVFTSHFSRDSNLPGYLRAKLRIYSEPDILWYIEKRKMDFYDLNIIDYAAYINRLKMENSDNKVELVITQNKGFRKGTNERHPHSWSILDVDEFLDWIK